MYLTYQCMYTHIYHTHAHTHTDTISQLTLQTKVVRDGGKIQDPLMDSVVLIKLRDKTGQVRDSL